MKRFPLGISHDCSEQRPADRKIQGYDGSNGLCHGHNLLRTHSWHVSLIYQLQHGGKLDESRDGFVYSFADVGPGRSHSCQHSTL